MSLYYVLYLHRHPDYLHHNSLAYIIRLSMIEYNGLYVECT